MPRFYPYYNMTWQKIGIVGRIYGIDELQAKVEKINLNHEDPKEAVR
jgi:hypothetical protein